MNISVNQRLWARALSLTLLASTVSYVALSTQQADASAPTTAPGTPSIEVEPGDGYLSVTGHNTSSIATDRVVYSLDGGAWTLLNSNNGSPDGAYGITGSISGLMNGTAHSVAFEAVNSYGSSAASASVTETVGAPQAPTNLDATPGNGSASVAFADSDNNGFAITGYQYAIVGSPQDYQPLPLSGGTLGSGGAITATIPGLAAGATSIDVRAVGTKGAGPAALTSVTVGAPGAPTSLVVTTSGSTAHVSFAEGPSNGASITGYTYSVFNSSGGGQIIAAPLTPSAGAPGAGGTITASITGLSDGANQLTVYPMYRVNGAATAGMPATQSFATTNQAPQQGITDLDIEPADNAVTVSFQDSWASAGAASTDYQYTLDGGSTWHELVGTSPNNGLQFFDWVAYAHVVPLSGLINGQSVTVQIRSLNSAGHGPASAPLTFTVGAPSEPVLVSASAGNGQALLDIEPGTGDGAQVTSYDYSTDGVTWRPTGATIPSDGSYPHAVIAGLANGQQYSIYVRGVNSRGAGPSGIGGVATVTPGRADDVYPTITPGSGSATLAIDESTFSNGGSPILSYQVSTDGAATWNPLPVTGTPGSGGKLTALITSLMNGTSYGIDVRAVTALGNGSSNSVQTVVPGQPLAPTVTAATPGNLSATLTFTESGGGGARITGYDYTLDASPWQPLTVTGPIGTGARLTAKITGLTNRKTYYNIEVRAEATSSSGSIVDGAASLPGFFGDTSSVTPGQALPPDVSSAVVGSGDGSATITFTEAADGGSAITGYQQSTWDNASPYANTSYRKLTITSGTPGSGATITGAITGLTNGHVYNLLIRAITALGDGTGVNAALLTPTAQPPVPAPPVPAPPAPKPPAATPIIPIASGLLPLPTAAAPVPTVPVPTLSAATLPAAPSAPSVNNGVAAGRPAVANVNGVVTARCTLANSAVAYCAVTFTVTSHGHKVVVGSGRAAGGTVKVALNAVGKATINTPGGARLAIQASITAANGKVLVTNTTALFVAPVVTVKAPISVASPSLTAVDKHAIAVLKSQLGAAKSVTCTGYVDSRSPAALAKNEAATVCAALVKGTHLAAVVIGRGAAQPVASNATATGRAANRRVTIVLRY